MSNNFYLDVFNKLLTINKYKVFILFDKNGEIWFNFRDLLNALDYLIDENGLSEAKGKEYVARLLDNKKVNDEKFYWQVLNILLPIIALVLFAIIFSWSRKRKYTS